MPNLYALLVESDPDVPTPGFDAWQLQVEHFLEVVEVTPGGSMQIQAMIPLGPRRAWSFAVSPTHQRVFLPDSVAGEVVVFDTAGGVLGSVTGLDRPYDCVLSRDESVLFVSTNDGIVAIDTLQLTMGSPVIPPLSVGAESSNWRPWHASRLALTADGGTLIASGNTWVNPPGSQTNHTVPCLTLADTPTLSIQTKLVPALSQGSGSISYFDIATAGHSPLVAVYRLLAPGVSAVDMVNGSILPWVETPVLDWSFGGFLFSYLAPTRLAYSGVASRAYVGGWDATVAPFDPDLWEPRVWEVELGVGATPVAGIVGAAFALTLDESERWLYAAQRNKQSANPDILALYDTVSKTLTPSAYVFSRPDLTVLAMQVVGHGPFPPPRLPFEAFDPDQWKLVVTILVGVKEGGGGVAITPSGKIIPIDPPPILEDPTPVLAAVRAAKIAQAAEEHPVPEIRRQIQERAVETVVRELTKAGVGVNRIKG